MSSVHVDVVRTDDEAGAVIAVNHLVELGHRSIAHVDGGRGPGAQERRQGYRKAMRAAGLEPRILPGGLTEEFGAAAARSMVEGGLPGAVFAFNDRCALGVLDVFLRAGILGAWRRFRDRIRQQCIGRLGAHRSDQCRAGHGVSGRRRGGADSRTPRRRKWAVGQGHCRAAATGGSRFNWTRRALTCSFDFNRFVWSLISSPNVRTNY